MNSKCYYMFFCTIYNKWHFDTAVIACYDSKENSRENIFWSRYCNCSCEKKNFLCANGNCIPKNKLCNGYDDCNDNSDETTICTGTNITAILGTHSVI